MAGRPIWYELMTPDPAAVAPFYRAVIGWDIPAEGMEMPNGSEYRMIGRADGGNAGGVLTLSPGMQQMGAKAGWLTYFHVEDVDAATDKAKALGATVHMPPTTMGGAGRMAMLSDPQGAHFYLMTPTPPPDQPDAVSDVFKAEGVGHCQWNELETTDEPAATAFYTTLLGWTAEDAMPMPVLSDAAGGVEGGERGNYRFVEAKGERIGAVNPWMSEWMPVSWLPYFGVADIEAARAAAEAGGMTIHHDIHEVPGGAFIFTGTDPAGAPIGIVGPKKGA